MISPSMMITTMMAAVATETSRDGDEDDDSDNLTPVSVATTTSSSNAPSTASLPSMASNQGGRSPRRLKPLTIEEYETKFRSSASDSELIERVYAGSLSCNQLRAALWPYLLGIVTHRGRFERIARNTKTRRRGWMFIEHEANKSRWRDLQKKYETYRGQWRSILPEQEPRFSTFRERKSLIETDVIRCDRLHPFYAENSENLNKLTSLLMTYMMYDFDIGYLQGMSDIAAPIVYVMQGDLVKSFWVFVEVMKLFRRNFEASQKTIHFQLNCLYRLIKLTDRKFAHYLRQNECSNCFFAFRCIVCQFKRELMKCNQPKAKHERDQDGMNGHDDTNTDDDDDDDSEEDDHLRLRDNNNGNHRDDEIISFRNKPTMNGNSHPKVHNYDYSNVLKLWDTIWCVQRRHDLLSTFNLRPTEAVKPELTETEKFMLSLCLSMIRRERNNIILNCMDATEIHLLFINPHLACDLDDFINQAYEIYNYLNTDCDLERVVKGANEFSPDGCAGCSAGSNKLATKATTNGNGDMSPVTKAGIDIKRSEPISWHKDSPDTYDLLKDYLIISPHSYNTSASSTLAHNNLIGSINYIGNNTHHHSNNNHRHKPWIHFIDNSPPT